MVKTGITCITLLAATMCGAVPSSIAQASSDEFNPKDPFLVKPVVPGGIDTKNYPYIKWKPKYVTGMPGTIVQMETKCDGHAIKFKIVLFKAKFLPNLTVRFLDKDGFKVYKDYVYPTDFHPIPDTEAFEANDTFKYFYEGEYRKAVDVDYSVQTGRASRGSAVFRRF